MTLFTKQPGAGSKGATDQQRRLPQQLFRLSLDLEAPHAQLVFAASELIEQQAEEIKRLKQAAGVAAGMEDDLVRRLGDQCRYQHSVLTEIYEMSRHPEIVDVRSINVKARAVMAAAIKSGLLA